MNSLRILTIAVSVFLLTFCSGGEKEFDAYGHFETTGIKVFAETPGRLIDFSVDAGDIVERGQLVGMIDTSSIVLQIEQVKAGISAAMAKIPGIDSQREVVVREIELLNKEIDRLESLVRGGAASRKQLDDLLNQRELSEARLVTFKTQVDAVIAETRVQQAQLELYRDKIRKSAVRAPIDGTVLESFVNKSELVAPGKLLFTVADLNNMELKAYVSGEQLSALELGQRVTARIDWEEGKYREYSGKISWIASEAEFTPKIIQTKKERVSLVYSIKILVQNDGKIKIGMPGEVIF